MAHHAYTGQYATFGYVPQYGGEAAANGQQHHPLGQQTILDQSDSAFMDTFFKNPDMTDTYDGGFNFSMDQKQDPGGFGNTFPYDPPATIHNPEVSLANVQSSTCQTHAHPQHYNGNDSVSRLFDGMQQVDDTGPNADVQAAIGLTNMSSFPEGQSHSHAMSPNGFGVGSWGNLGAPSTMSAPDHLQSPLTSSGRNSSGSTIYTPTTKGNSSSTTHLQLQHPSQAQLQAHYMHNQNQHQRLHGHRTGSLVPSIESSGLQFFPDQQAQDWRTAQSAFPHGQNHDKPQEVPNFGSDPGFSGQAPGYHPPGYVPPELHKGGNLLSVPLAQQAAHPQMQHTPYSAQQQVHDRHSMSGMRHANSTTSSPGGIGGRLIASPLSGVQRAHNAWSLSQSRSAVEDYDQDFEESSQPRKRRKSQMDRGIEDEEGEYIPSSPERGNIPKRGPQVPKAEGADYDTYFTTPVSKNPGKRRKSTVTALSRVSLNSVDENASPSVMPSESPAPGATSSTKKKPRGDPKPRLNLSEAEKRENHIKSEQKRRNLIKDSFEDINRLVPALQSGQAGFSKSEILRETAVFLEQLVAGNAAIAQYIGSNHDGGEDGNGQAREGDGGRGGGAVGVYA